MVIILEITKVDIFFITIHYSFKIFKLFITKTYKLIVKIRKLSKNSFNLFIRKNVPNHKVIFFLLNLLRLFIVLILYSFIRMKLS